MKRIFFPSGEKDALQATMYAASDAMATRARTVLPLLENDMIVPPFVRLVP
jgi:hypothetical protein